MLLIILFRFTKIVHSKKKVALYFFIITDKHKYKIINIGKLATDQPKHATNRYQVNSEIAWKKPSWKVEISSALLIGSNVIPDRVSPKFRTGKNKIICRGNAV